MVINVVKHPYTIISITNIKKFHLQFKSLSIKYNCKLMVVKLGQPQSLHFQFRTL